MTKKLIRINYQCKNTIYMKTFRVEEEEFNSLEDPILYFQQLLESRKDNKPCKIQLLMICSEEDKIEQVIECVI